MPSAKAIAVVVNWNGGEQNLECLESLVRQGLSSAEIVFVDNGSTDGSREAVERRFPGLVLVRNRENLWFGEGANQGQSYWTGVPAMEQAPVDPATQRQAMMEMVRKILQSKQMAQQPNVQQTI